MLLGVDIGGTFTDFVYRDGKGALESFKIPSIPTHPARAIEMGLKLLPKRPEAFLHGTTVATNTILERKGSRTALVTTRGFRDLLHIGRQTRPSLYDFRITRREPLINRRHCFELTERVDANGRILVPLDESELEDIARRLKHSNIEAVAVCLLFSYINSRHERKAARYLKKNLNVPVTLSSEIQSEFREYERFSTTAMNAYLLPPVGKYINNLRSTMTGIGLKEFFVMQSSGGIALSDYIRNVPVRTLLSGPAAGVAASAELGKVTGESNLITFDMGGTSADVSAVIDNEIVWSSEGAIDSLPLKVPMVSIETIGAGGGSIAWLDSGGALQVGPKSAGAEPGPVCYGRGGREITVTDANVLLGIISPEFFLGGKYSLDASALSRTAERFAGKLGYKVDEMAEGVLRVVEANMLRAVKKVSVEKGFEPHEFAMVAFGGAGPIHAPVIARELRIPRMIVPIQPGTFSAYGLLVSDIKFDYTQTCLSDTTHPGTADKIKSIMDRHLKTAHKSVKAQKLPLKNTRFCPSVDLRYRGQSFEVNVSFEDSIEDAVEKFHKAHEIRFGYCVTDAPVELVNVRLEVVVQSAGKSTSGTFKPSIQSEVRTMRNRNKNKRLIKAEKHLRTIFNGSRLKTPLYNRARLEAGMELEGPAIISDSGSTTLIYPEMTARIDNFGNIIITI